ncbi:VCBS domain-containing protein [Desulfovibrio piger]|uniref:VCBS domain-containing protein n=1 Tax=Desulfovibrio piger TaxID=901 RepID=UPI0026F30BAA|nr:VCBS domain-containing protein [Desulfovibrio piger]
MADIRLAKPAAGTTQTVPSAPDGRFIFDFPADAATLTRNGDDLVLSFEDGSSIQLQGFYTTYSKEEMPSFQVDGVEISGQDFFAALGEDLMPAAGPAASNSASRGGRYNEYGGSDLLDGIDHLGRLDIGFDDGVEWADDKVGGWPHQNLDPEISGIIAVDGNDMTLVESGVETDEGQEIQGNVFTPGVPVVVGQVMASDPDGGRLSYSFADGSNRIVTEYGVITIDADTGVITYTLNNDDPDADSLALGETVRQDFTVRVEDGQGGKAEASFTVTIKGTNDQPEVSVDAHDKPGDEYTVYEEGHGRTDTNEVVKDWSGTGEPQASENAEYAYNDTNKGGTVSGRLTGHDVDHDAELTFGAAYGTPKGNPELSDFVDSSPAGKDAKEVPGTFGTLTLKSDGTWTYTLKGDQREEQEFTASDGKTYTSLDNLSEGVTVTETFTFYVRDEHGAWHSETKTITITGTNDKPTLTLKDVHGNVVAEPLVTEESEPTKDDSETIWSEVTGKFEVADVDADAGLDQTIRIEGGTYELAEGEEYTTTGTSSEGHIGSESGTETSATFTTDYGTLTVNPDGTWTYEVNGDSLKVQQLDPRNPHYETFEITVVDEHGAYDTQTIVIKLDGESAFPVITDHVDLVFKEEGVYDNGSDGNTKTELGDVVDANSNVNEEHHSATKLEGKVTATDVDLGDQGNLIFSVVANGATLQTGEKIENPGEPKLQPGSTDDTTVYESDYGTLTFNKDGSYTYELKSGDDNAVNKLAQGQVLTETFTVTVTDTFGKFVSQEITITIHGTNDKPTLSLSSGEGDGSLHVMESGVGRHEDGTVVNGPDDEILGETGSPQDEVRDYTEDKNDSGNAIGSDADNNAQLVYGAVAGNMPSSATLPDEVDFTESGKTQVTVEGLYGTLIIDADGNYSYELNEHKSFSKDGQTYSSLDQLNEGDTLEETFTIFVKDEHGAWASKEVTVTVTGTNDRPALEVTAEKIFFDADHNQVEVADDSLHAYGTASEQAVVTTLYGRVEATDADRENGAGAATTSKENHGLEFSLQETGYSGESSSSEWTDRNGETHDGNVEVTNIGNGTWTASTPYGTLTLDVFGNYTYELGDNDAVTALGDGETVTETFVVRVVDDRGAWREETITITIKGTNDKPELSDKTSSSLTVHEEGVWGSQDDGHSPDEEFTENTGAQTETVTFDKRDAHDTHSLVIAGDLALTVKYPDGWTGTGDATYSITDNGDGIYTLTAIIPGVNDGNPITLGELKLEQNGGDGTLNYTFTPNQDGLNGLPQDMDLSVDIPLKVEDQHGSLSDATHTATINIHGTNDRPTIAFGTKEPKDVYADGVGREQDGTVVDTDNGKDLNPAENKVYESQEVTGKLTADDADAGDDSFTFFVEDVTEGKGNIPLECTVNGDDSVTLTLGGGKVAELVLNPTTGEYTLKLLEGAEEALKEYGEDAAFSFTVTFNVRDKHGSTAEKSVTQKFTIHGTNDAPEISTAEGLNLEEGGEDKSGNVEAIDPDTNAPKAKLTFGLLDQDAYGKLTGTDSEVKMQDRIDTDYGFLEIDAKGEYTFHLDNDSEAVISLAEGQEKTLTFYGAVRDDKGAWDVKEIIVTITGKDTATVFTGDAAVVTVQEEGFKHYNNPVDFPGGPDRGDPSFASGRLEAKDFDTDADGKPHEVEFTIKTKEGETGLEKKAFRDLGDDIKNAIKEQFPDGADGDKASWDANDDIQILKGTYGTLYLNTATGQYFYQLDNDLDATQGLKLGEIQYDDFTIHAQGPGDGEDKGADQPLKVAVQGSNDAPKITEVTLDDASIADGLKVEGDGFTVKGLKEDGSVTEVKGSIAATDVDSPDTGEDNVLKYLIKVVDGDKVSYLGALDSEYGYLSLQEDGSYTFVFYNDKDEIQKLKEGEDLEVTFTVVAVDEHNAVSEEKDLTFTITGTDDAPVITGSSDSITEDDSGTADLSATISDDDNEATPEITKVEGKDGIVELTGNGPWEITGQYGTLTVTRTPEGELKYEYTLTEDLQYLNVDSPSLKEEFIVHGQSGDKDAQGTITVTITGENDAPTLTLKHDEGTMIENGAIQVDGWEPVKGEANGWDVDNRWDKDEKDPELSPELRYSVSKGETPGSEPGEGGEEQASSLQTIKGEFGYLTINSVTGEYTYVVDPFSEAYQGLEKGGFGKETFTIWVKDPHGAYAKQKIVFDVTKVEGEGGGKPIELQQPEDIPEVIEDNNNYDVTLPPYVESDFERLLDVSGNPVGVPADQIWLLNNDGKPGSVTGDKTHVVETDYGSLILEKNENGEWGYRFVLNNSSEAVQELTEEDKINLEFRVGTEEGKEVPINVTITGINDRPVIESVTDLTVKDMGGVVPGEVETSDPDKVDVGSAEDGERNLIYKIEAEDDGFTLTKEGEMPKPEDFTLELQGTPEEGDPRVYNVMVDGKKWGEFTLNEDGSYTFTPSEYAKDLLQGEKAEFDLKITVDDGHGKENSTASDTIHITIEGTNEAPVIEKAPSLEVKEDMTLTNGQQLEVSDDRGDGSNNLSYSVAAGDVTGEGKPMAAGQYGTLFIDAQGKYHYQLNNQLKAVQELGEGESLEDTFTIFVKDKDGAVVEKTVTVNIEGTNDDPVLSLDKPVLTIKEGTDEPVTGDALATDVDGDTLTYSLRATGDGMVSEENGEYVYKTDYGTFYINKTTGEYRFKLDNDAEAVKNLRPTDVVEDKVTVVVTDGHGKLVEKELTVHIKGTDSKPEVTDEESLQIDVAEEKGSETEGGQIKADGWDRGPAPDASDDPLHYSVVGAKPVTIDGKVWHKVEGEHGILYIDPKTGEYRYELTKDMEYLAEGENPQDIFNNITITDSTGNKITETITVTIKGENDVPSIVVSQPSDSQSGTVTITDVDTRDTHEVTFTGLYGSAEDARNATALQVDLTKLENGKPLDVFNAEGEKIGELTLTYSKGGGAEDQLKYDFKPDEDYLNSLPVGEGKDINFGITVSDGHGGGTATQGGLHFTVTNENDAPVITDSNIGSLVFTDADELDTQHSVTFNGLYADANGNALTVELGNLPEDGKVAVFQNGLQIGTLTLIYVDGKLSYSLSTAGFEDNLPVGPSDITFTITVSDKHNGTATTGDLRFSVSNENDAPVISDESTGPNADNTGTLVFTDADVKDTHSVTFGSLSADAAGAPLTVDLDSLPEEPVDVYQDGQKVGTLELHYAKGEDGKGGTLEYEFKPDEGYLNSLPVGENEISFGITVSDGNDDGEATQGGLNFTVTNENDAPEITTSEGPSADNNTGKLVFTDADVKDTHSVTFTGLTTEGGEALTVELDSLTEEGKTVDVYQGGQKVGTLGLHYAKGEDGKGGTLEYGVTPDEDYSGSLGAGVSKEIEFTITVTDAGSASSTTGSLSFTVTSTAEPDSGDGEGTEGETIIVPDDGNRASLKADGQRQRLAAEEAGLLTAAASFVAGITPESADPETFLQGTVPAQEDAPEAFVAEEIPLPQDETVPQEEAAYLPNADVPVSEMPLGDDLLAAPLLFAGLESTAEMPEPVEMLRPEAADETLFAENADPATAATPPASNGEEAGIDGLLLPEGVEGLFGTDGDDYLRGGEGSDAIFGGVGNDIIVYDQQDYLVSGGSGIDFMVSDDTSLTLDGLLSNTGSDKPLVSGIEVLLKGEDALSLTSIKDLADRYGITLGVNEAGEETLQLDDRWTKQDDGSYDFNGGAEADGGLTLETNLTPVETSDPASEAVQQQVFTLEHSNG